MQTRLDLYQKVTPLAGLGIWEYHLTTGETYWNAIMWNIYGMSPQAVPPNDHIKTLYHDEMILNTLIDQAMTTLIPQVGEFRIKTHSGISKWVKLRINTESDHSGCTKLYGTLEDITASKALEEEREATVQLLSDQNSRLTNFAHIVSHNLRTHSGNIKTLAELIPHESDEEEKKQMQEMLLRQASSLLETLNQLNVVVDVHSRSFDKIEKLNLLETVKHVLVVLEQPISKHNVNLNVLIDPAVVIEHKAAYLESILVNLISNAIKYRSQERPCCITLRTHEYGGYVTLEVADNGIGIDLDRYKNKVFGLYNTFHGNTDAQGVGLYLVRSQVEALGGKIDVQSEPGQGASFRIQFKSSVFI